MRNADQAEHWISDWESGLRASAERAGAVVAALARLQVIAQSTDGLVEVTVGAQGAILDLKLDGRIQRQPAERTAHQILATIQAALSELATRVNEVMSAGITRDDRDAAG